MAAKYEIRVTKVHEDGTREPYFFDRENTIDAANVNGFAILGAIDGGSLVSIHDVNPIDLAQAIDASEHLRLAARLALAVGMLSRHCGDKEDADAAQ